MGLVYKDGIVLGADTRATEGDTVCDKNCEKIHYIAPNIWCCGAGTAADTEAVTGMVARQLEILTLNLGREARVVTAVTKLKRHLFRYQGHVSAALVLGGVDFTGPHLYTVYPHGSTDKLPYVTMGSGSLAAMSIFEAEYREDMEEEEAKALVAKAIRSGIFNDLGSGSNVDIRVIRKGVTEEFRNCEMPNEVAPLRAMVKPSGTSHPALHARLFRLSITIACLEPVFLVLLLSCGRAQELSHWHHQGCKREHPRFCEHQDGNHFHEGGLKEPNCRFCDLRQISVEIVSINVFSSLHTCI